MRRRGLLLCAVPAFLLALAGLLGSLLANPHAAGNSHRALKPPLARAEVAFHEMDFPRCEGLLRLHLTENPNDPVALLLLARVFKATGKLSESSKILLTLSRFEEVDAETLGAAARALTELSTMDPRSPEPFKALAFCLFRCGDRLGALSAAHKALELAPSDGELIALMSRAAESATLSAGQSRGVLPTSRGSGSMNSYPAGRRAPQ